jgi:hypothetical protein
MCKEDHCNVTYVPQYSLGIQITSAWNIPTCGGSAVISVPGLYGASPGSYLWNSSFGYFEIVSVDTEKQTITITNPCLVDNAAPGTSVPKCTTFIVTDPPCCEDVLNTGVCVKLDFTAPPLNTPVDITLTSVEGLIAGNYIQIGSAIYLLQTIKPNNVVTIINKGEGAIPGTPVYGLDQFGRCQNRVILLSRNPCAVDPVDSGPVIVCKEGVSAPLTVPDSPSFLIGNHSNKAGIFKPAGCGLRIDPNTFTPSVNVSGIWGDPSLSYSGPDTNGSPIYCSASGVIRTIPKYVPQAYELIVSDSSVPFVEPGQTYNTAWSSVLTITPPLGRNYIVYIILIGQANCRIGPATPPPPAQPSTPAAGVIGARVEIDRILPTSDNQSNLQEQYVYLRNQNDSAATRPHNIEPSFGLVYSFTNTQVSSFRIRASIRSVSDLANDINYGLKYGGGSTLGVRGLFFVIGVD